MISDTFDFYKLPVEQQAEFLGQDIGINLNSLVVELDERSQACWYKDKYTIIHIQTQISKSSPFKINIFSRDDACVSMSFPDVNQQEAFEIFDKILLYLKRTNYFINLVGFQDYCQIFGKIEFNNN